MKQLTVRIPERSFCWNVTVDGGKIVKLEKAGEVATDLWLTRGLIDIQVNGYMGIDLTKPDLTVDECYKVEEMLAEDGVTRWCPTLVTDTPETLLNSCKVIDQAIKEGAMTRAECIHFEAVFISPKDGFRGVHMKDCIKPPSIELFEKFQKASGDRIGYVTIAPEQEGAEEFISYLASKGIIVALGHHDASLEQVTKAADLGAKLCTHLFNGCAAEVNRHNNPIYYQLAEDRLWASFIPDGRHIPYHALKVGLRAKGINHTVFTSDLVHLGGLEEGLHATNIGDVEIRDQGIWVPGKKILAGAWCNLAQGISRVTSQGVVTPEQALILSSLNPARLLDIEKQYTVSPGSEGPFALFREEKGALNFEGYIED